MRNTNSSHTVDLYHILFNKNRVLNIFYIEESFVLSLIDSSSNGFDINIDM